MAYRLTPSGAIEPHLFAEPLRQDRAGAQPVYSAAVREGIVFSDGTPLTAAIAAASLAKAGALRGRDTVSARDGRVHFAMTRSICVHLRHLRHLRIELFISRPAKPSPRRIPAAPPTTPRCVRWRCRPAPAPARR